MENEKDPRKIDQDSKNQKPNREERKEDQQRSDPPLTEIKGVTDPEEYVEPKVEEVPEK